MSRTSFSSSSPPPSRRASSSSVAAGGGGRGGSMRRRGVAILLLGALLAVALGPDAVHAKKSKKKSKNKVTTLILTPADYPCTDDRYRAGKTDVVKVNYKGSVTSDGTVFEDTFKVGRPMEFTLGTGGVIAGWEKGIPGMCVGETRRIYIPAQFAYGEAGQAGKIPPNAHLTFDVELLAINGKDFTALRAEEAAMAAAGQAAGEEEGSSSVDGARGGGEDNTDAATTTAATNAKDEDILAIRMGQRDSPYCDACSTVLEEFYGSWVTTMMKQVSSAEARGGGSAPPAVTYNDDTEAMVQSFCTNRSVSQINSAPPVYVPHVKLACERIMKLRKRELVGQFLSAELDGRILPEKNAVVCGEWLGACPRQARGKNTAGTCGVCRLMVEDLAFETRRSFIPSSSSSVSKDAVRTRVGLHLEHVCQNAYYRRPLKRDDVDACEDLVDDHRELILDTYVRAGGEVGGVVGDSSGTSGAAWLEVARKVCVEEAELCTPSSVTAKNFPEHRLLDHREEL